MDGRATVEASTQIVVNELDPIRFNGKHLHDRQVPTFVSDGTGGKDEIARWVIDANGIAYEDRPHMPLFAERETERLAGAPGPGSTPVLVMTDTLIYGVDSIVRYWEERCPPDLRTIAEGAARASELRLYGLFTRRLDDLVQKYMLARLFAEPAAARSVLGGRAPLTERLQYRLLFRPIRARVSADLHLPANTPAERLVEIRKIFDRVSELLSDGRRYLSGERLGIADIAFAAVGATVILPEEFGGVIPRLRQIPQAYREDVIELRKTAAGQHILRLYREDRPSTIPRSELPKAPGPLAGATQRVSVFLDARKPGLFFLAQRRFPVLKVPIVRIAVVSRKALVTELLDRDGDFTVEEINSHKMAAQKGAFFLGWDRANPQFDRERDFARSAVRPGDLERIRAFVRDSATEVLAANREYGRIDVADTLCRPVLVRLIDSYFGIAAPNDRMMMDWLRILFDDLFLNFRNVEKIHAEAVAAGLARRDRVCQVIAERRTVLDAGGTLPDNVLNRMILLAREPGYEWVDEDVLNRNIGGLITGILQTTNQAVVHALGVLLDRPAVLPGAIAAARAGDADGMYGYVAEALRFLPVQPGVLRYCETERTLTGGGSRRFTIKRSSTVLALTSGAMFDPAAFPDPRSFDPQRAADGARYMNWGFGLHECFGRHINTVTVPELTAAVLRLNGLRRAAGMVGRGTGLKTLGFPDNFVLSFDPEHEDESDD